MKNLMKPIICLTLVLSLVCLSACTTTEIRHSDEDYRTTAALDKSTIADISVLPIEMGPTVANETLTERQLPARRMRGMIRGYLVEQKNYAAPRSFWVDEKSSEQKDLNTDALLNVSVMQWDTSSLERRGVIYATATFELKSPNGNDLLWRYTCTDYQLIVDAPHGGQALGSNNLAAARLLAETALSRLPKK